MGKKLLLLMVFATMASVTLPGREVRHAVAGANEGAKARESCVTDACHAKMGKDKFVHGPVAVGECLSCHKQKGKHKFEPIADSGKLCYECHEELNKQQVVHAPVKSGKCVKCHDPHQSPNKFQLRASGGELCFLCHDKAIAEGKFVHGPAAVGSCSTCHAPHQSANPKLVLAKGNELCFSCHLDKADDFKAAKFMHPPVREACVNCHSPHSGGYRYNFALSGDRELCLTCHADKEQSMKEVTVPHKALDRDRKCLNCHDPHFSNYAKQLTRQPAELCLSCHDREYNDRSGKVANVKAVLADNADHHGPIRQNDCSSCHDPHGSKNFRILREFFPQVFYAGYKQDNYKLCFRCHEKTIANEQNTTKLTNFRNGDHNLHFVHVNKTVKGRTCRACHDAHATSNPKHVRDGVPFGKWVLPINFKKTETGGSCLPGCHVKFGYDRVAPVVNKATTATR